LFIPDQTEMPTRRYDLDWLRILAFGLLIFYHTGMLYVADWGFHIKSQYQSESLQTVMLLVNPWRMPILWMVSGIAIRFVLAKVSPTRFIVQRSYRLLLPLLFAILVIVPPQLYYEMTQNGDLAITYWEFYCQFFDLDNPIFEKYPAGIWHHIDVNHLWYLRELWTFSLYLVFLLPLLNSGFVARAIDWLASINGYLLILVIAIPILLIQSTIDDTKEPLGLLFLVYGYSLGWHPVIWGKLKSNAFQLLLGSCLLYVALAFFYNLVWLNASERTNELLLLAGGVVYSLDTILWVCCTLALSTKFLSKSSDKLSYLNDAVYPYYILHQTIIVVIGFKIARFQLGVFLEPIIVLVGTFMICGISFELIRRIDWLRPLFGLRTLNTYPDFLTITSKIIASILVVGIGLEILI